MRVAALVALGLLLAPLHAAAGDIRLAWNASPGAVAGYQVRYGTASGQYTTDVAVGNQLTATLTGLTDGVPYFFVVRSYSAAGTYSNPSNEVIGVTASTTFTDHPLAPGVSQKALHITELRARINRLRTLTNLLAPASWSESIVSGSTTMKALHITEMRTALQQAYAARNRPNPSFNTDPVLTPGTLIKAAHIIELRAAVETLEQLF
jgi:hypothetical protein